MSKPEGICEVCLREGKIYIEAKYKTDGLKVCKYHKMINDNN